MSEFEDSPHQNSQTKKTLQRHQTTKFSTRSGSSTHPLTPLREVREPEEGAEDDSAAGSPRVSRKSLMGRVKLGVSNILSSSWFSPTSKATTREAQEEQQQQQNGTGTTSLTKRKRGRRRIELAEPDGEDSPAGGLLPDVDDGAAARGLDYEEVALADNIAEHDLVGEDEQTRRSEYNVFALRKRRNAIAADDDFDDDDDEVPDGDEEEDEDDGDDDHAQASASPPPKRRQLELETSVHLPSMRRLPLPLVSSTPAAAAAASAGQLYTSGNSQALGSRSHSRGSNKGGVPPHRRTYMNLYHQHQQREPGYNFFAGNESAAEATTGDLPVSIRRSLNIPAIEHPRGRSFSFGQTSSSFSAVPLAYHKRPLLLGQTDTVPEASLDVAQSDNERIEHLLNICKSNNNISSSNNNNNNIIKSKRGTATATAAAGAEAGSGADLESELNEYAEAVEASDSYPYHHNNNNSNNNSDQWFYGNLQSAKSIFTRGSAQPTHHNSTCSLNSLNKRRRFNAYIYGSSSALSDSRLLTRSASASAWGSGSTLSSPFYKGQTTFGGNSAHNRIFGQSGGSSSSVAMNSGDRSPAAHQAPTHTGYRINKIAMGPRKQKETPNTSVVDSMSLSTSTRRILSLLETYSSPLFDVKRLGNTLKEQQQQQQQQLQKLQTSISYSPPMQQVLERRRLHRVTKSSKELLLNYKPKPSSATTMALAALPARHTNNNSHTNKMRSRLSHTSSRKPREDNELAPEPLDLPMINFPAMANTPTFDLVIKPPPPPTVPSVTVNPTTDLQMSARTQTAVPRPAVNFVGANVNSAATETARAPANASGSGSGSSAAWQPSNVSGRRFSFVEPIPVPILGEGETAQESRNTRHFSFPAPASFEMQQQKQSLPFMNGPTTAASAHNPSSSQQSVVGGFSQQFMKSATEWECDVCMIRNKSELVRCAACETPKPSKTAAPPTSAVPLSAASGFGDRFKKSSSAWECDTCMITNKSEDSKCVACETPRQGATTAATKTTTDCFSITNSPGCGSGSGSGSGSGFSTSSSSSGFGQAFRPKANTWECQTCLVMNQTSAVECVACQSRNPNASSESSSSSSTSNTPTNVSSSTSNSNTTSFKFGFTPEQQQQQQAVKQGASFQQLAAAQKECCCCEQLRPRSDDCKPSSNATHPVPTFTFGFVGKSKGKQHQSSQPCRLPTSKRCSFSSPLALVQSKDVADSNNASTGGFKFGALPTQEEPKSIDLRAIPTATKATSTTGIETAATGAAGAAATATPSPHHHIDTTVLQQRHGYSYRYRKRNRNRRSYRNYRNCRRYHCQESSVQLWNPVITFVIIGSVQFDAHFGQQRERHPCDQLLQYEAHVYLQRCPLRNDQQCKQQH
ncbi:GL15021 [Drosophila persimilis]|uniref:Nuclear pore complex protein Nup153 n=1 Tax=Drosophila persimilis TaxID=7234 RepID=B4H0N7_DROPE|nr:GL15021 [Drosophila persimilis]